MKKIYLNKEFQCFTQQTDDTVMNIETAYFDGKCNAYIEGYRFVPAGCRWTREDGNVFYGEMVSPFKDSTYLEMVQSVYEQLASEITDTQLTVAQLYESGVAANG
ncbi:MAG: hypothetical protein IKJ05_04280 [Oscillospiraceae bacterium]|nr:hypothetical protein [Oscillospiraceae bacterium]